MHYSVHPPSSFIRSHLDRLLPDWSRPVASVLVVLQPSSCNFLDRTPVTESQKQFLRQNFIELGCQVATKLQQVGHLVAVFDPCTGLPVNHQPGQIGLDDVAVAGACLGYPTMNRYGCSVILHPDWGSAVYPSTLLSTAEPSLVEAVVRVVRSQPHISEALISPVLPLEAVLAYQSATSL